MQINTIRSLFSLLAPPKTLFVTTHTNPDGDAIGSIMGLYHFLKQYGHTIHLAIPNEMPDFLEWIPDAKEKCVSYEKKPELVKNNLAAADFIFCLDFNNPYRVGTDMAQLLINATQPKVLIDHHMQPKEDFFQYIYSDDDKSSTCEMVYDFIQMMEGLDKMNNDIMQSIYTGLVTDTGSFRFTATSSHVHQIVIDFKQKEFDHSYVHEQIYDASSENRLRFLGYLLSEKMVVSYEHQYGYIHIGQEDLTKYNAQVGDTEGVVNYILSIKGVSVAILATERKDGLKLSFRSKKAINVSQFAKDNFSGGGHFNAAGAKSNHDWDTTLKIIQEKLPTIIRQAANY